MPHYELNREERAELDKPINGQGGFETLMRRLKKQFNPATSEIKLTADDIAAIGRCATYGKGTFEDRLLAIFGRVLGPKLGRE